MSSAVFSFVKYWTNTHTAFAIRPDYYWEFVCARKSAFRINYLNWLPLFFSLSRPWNLYFSLSFQFYKKCRRKWLQLTFVTNWSQISNLKTFLGFTTNEAIFSTIDSGVQSTSCRFNDSIVYANSNIGQLSASQLFSVTYDTQSYCIVLCSVCTGEMFFIWCVIWSLAHSTAQLHQYSNVYVTSKAVRFVRYVWSEFRHRCRDRRDHQSVMLCWMLFLFTFGYAPIFAFTYTHAPTLLRWKNSHAIFIMA